MFRLNNHLILQSLSTIDPARQAMDALNNRCVCLMPVLHFAVEILAPNASTKTGSSSNSRFLLTLSLLFIHFHLI